MGKFYDLVKFRNDLVEKSGEFDLTPAVFEKIEILTAINTANTLDALISMYQQLDTDSRKIPQQLNSIIEQVNAQIDLVTNELFNSEEYCNEFLEHQIRHTLPLPFDIENLIGNQISHYSDWHYPALQINPRVKKWIDFMVSADPLYLSAFPDPKFDSDTVYKPPITLPHALFDTDKINSLKELVNAYPEQYQRRLRLYKSPNRKFHALPQGQFSFVLCWDTFNYLNLQIIKQYLTEVYNLLRPGGTFMFSYNNCDLLTIAKLIEDQPSPYSYASSRVIRQISQELGYEITKFQDIKLDNEVITHVSWVEIRKPGTLTTVKAGQAMARIEYK